MKPITRVPPVCLITPEPQRNEPLKVFIEPLDFALRAGIRWLQLRAKAVTSAQYVWLAGRFMSFRCITRIATV